MPHRDTVAGDANCRAGERAGDDAPLLIQWLTELRTAKKYYPGCSKLPVSCRTQR